MHRALFALLACFVVVSTFATEAPTVTFVSACECQGFHGKNRWVAKADLSPVPLDKSVIQSVHHPDLRMEGARAECGIDGNDRGKNAV